MALKNGKITGAVDSKNNLTLNESTVVVGPVVANNIVTAGKAKGNINAADCIKLTRNSILLGDIKAANVSIDYGAMVKERLRLSVILRSAASFLPLKNPL